MNLILIHGALGSAQEMLPIVPFFEKNYTVHCYEIPGHGARKTELEKYTLTEIVDDFRAYISEIGDSLVFGFSLGGYLALTASLQGEKRITGVVTLGTKVKWSLEEAKNEVQNLDLDFLQTKAAPFYTYLKELHGEHLESLCEATGKFMLDLGVNPPLGTSVVSKIKIPVRMGRGGKDRMVDSESTKELVDAMTFGFYTEIPSFSHPIGFLKSNHVARFVSVQLDSMKYSWLDTVTGRLAYKHIGQPKENEPLVLFLHEGLGSITQWGDFPDKVCAELNLPGLIYERTGHGFSSETSVQRTSRYLHDFALSELPDFLRKMKIENPLILVGHSDGGSIALLYAAKYPERVEGMITMAAHVYNEDVTIEGIVKAREAWEETKLKGLEAFHGNKTEKLFFDWNDTWQTKDFLKWNIEEDICKNIDFPALIIQGEDDQYGTPQQVLDIVRILGDNAEGMLIEGAGHSPFLDKEDVIIAEISELCKQLE